MTSSRIVRVQRVAYSDKDFQEAITQFAQEQVKRLHNLVLTHHVSDDHVKNLIGLETHYKKAHKLQLQNALVHTKSKEVNKGMHLTFH
jgi:hypothetical protein